jgi:two-component system sensor kinase
MVGANCDRLFLPEDVAAGTRGGALDVAARAGRFEAESWRVRRDGTRFWANAVLSAVRAADGALAGFAEVTTDFTERRRFEEELASARERLRVLAQRLASVGEEEKARLAREIHDVLGGELTGLKLDAAWILRRLPRLKGPECGAVAERLASMMSQLDATVQTVRRIATGLRPQMLDDLGLPATVEWQALEFQERSGLEVAVMVPEAPTPIVPERGTALFRIFQELLTNIARHAGARRVRVKLTFERGEAVLAVEDDGRGVTDAEGASPRSLGIVGMRERAALFGGSLDIAGASGKGTRALLRIPLGHG